MDADLGIIVDDVKAGRVDWVVHAGDHAYEFAVDVGQLGDGYNATCMDAYQPLLESAALLGPKQAGASTNFWRKTVATGS